MIFYCGFFNLHKNSIEGDVLEILFHGEEGVDFVYCY
jgi:hypothetical protein